MNVQSPIHRPTVRGANGKRVTHLADFREFGSDTYGIPEGKLNTNLQWMCKEVYHRIFVYLRPREILGLILIHPRLRKHVENTGTYFDDLDFHAMTKKVPLAGVQKLIILAGNKLKALSIPGYFNSTDTMNILTYIPKSLETLEIRNINLDYRYPHPSPPLPTPKIFAIETFGPREFSATVSAAFVLSMRTSKPKNLISKTWKPWAQASR